MSKRLSLLIIVVIFMFAASAFAGVSFLSTNKAEKVAWSSANTKQTVYKLSRTIGVHVAGSNNEHRAANYIEQQLRDFGYIPSRQAFRIVNGKVSYNVLAQKSGRSSKKFILGAHYDSKSPSPGANDNGSGVAVLLELARVLKARNPQYTIVFVFFGAEEKVGSNSNNHHFGSRYYVRKMSVLSKKQTVGMLSVDMVGYGSSFHVRSMQRGTMRLVNSLLGFAKHNSYKLTYLKDPGSSGWSDHEAFELAGMPSAWLEWRNDPAYHSTKDNYAHMQWSKIDQTGQFLQEYLLK